MLRIPPGAGGLMEALVQCNWLLLWLICLLTLLNKVLKWISEPLAKFMVSMINSDSQKVFQLKNEIERAKVQLRSINQVDNFAEHARMQRALNQKKRQFDSVEKSRKTVLNAAVTTGQWVSSLITLIGRVLIIANYRSLPVVTLASPTLWPLGSLLAFPTGIPGGVGVPCWSVMCALALNSVSHFLKPHS